MSINTGTQDQMKDFLKNLLTVLATELDSGRASMPKVLATIPVIQSLESLDEIRDYLNNPPKGFEFLKEINFSELKLEKSSIESKIQDHMSKMIKSGSIKEANEFYSFAMENQDDSSKIKDKYPNFQL